MPVRPASPAPRSSLAARTLFPCYSADLKPVSEVLVSARGCTVLFSVEPRAAGTTASWEYESGTRKELIATLVPNKSAEISRAYVGHARLSEMDFSLQLVLRWWNGGFYRFRSESEATGWLELRVVGECQTLRRSRGAGAAARVLAPSRRGCQCRRVLHLRRAALRARNPGQLLHGGGR